MALIDLSNYATTLVQSTQGRAGTPDGNIYFNKTTGDIEFIDVSELATVDLTGVGGGATDPNPLVEADGIRMEAVYAFENQERRLDEDLRKYDRWTSGTFKFGGAYDFINSRVPATDADRKKLRGSGWRELTGSTVNRIYFGFKGLGAILGTSVPYYQNGQYAITTDLVDFTKLGNLDEAIQVFGDGTNGNFDNTLTSVYVSIRTYGQNYDRIDTQGTLGIAELGGYSAGAAVNESTHLTTSEGTYPIANVFGGAQAAPFTGMTLEKLVSAQTETGFAGADGNFTWVLNNTGAGTLYECVAYLDAIAIQDAVVTTGTESLNGKAYDTWYEYTAAGRIKPVVGTANFATEGLFIEGLTGADKQLVEFRDDAGTVCVYPVFTSVTVELGQGAIDDTNAWFHVFLATGYNTAGATTYDDAVAALVKGDANNTSAFISGANTFLTFEHDFTTDGSVNVIILCEGDGGVTQQKTAVTLADTAVNASCVPATENNA